LLSSVFSWGDHPLAAPFLSEDLAERESRPVSHPKGDFRDPLLFLHPEVHGFDSPLPAMVLFYTFPIFVAFISSLWFGEKIGKKELALIVIGLIGIYILINPGSHAFNQGYVFGLLASFIGAMAMVMIRKARETNGAMIIYFYFCVVGGAMSFPFFLYHFKRPDLDQGVLLLFLGLSLLIAQVMMNHAFKYCKAAEGSLLLMSEVVFTGIAGILLFKEQVTLHFW